MRITNFSLQKGGDSQELSAMIDGRRLWYRVHSGHTLDARADPFVIAGLLLAMFSGKDIHVDPAYPVSPRLCEGIDALQGIYSYFNPRLRPISVCATKSPNSPSASTGASFFSGGIDGMHTLLKNQDRIEALIFIRGIDFTLTNDDLFRKSLDANRRFAERYGKRLITVETNIRDFGYPNTQIGVTAFYGSILASVAQTLRFERTYVAAGLTYHEVGREGNFPLTWPLWSAEGCACICHGAESTRLDKIRFLATQPGILDELRICLTNTVYNCNVCEKCLINRAMLRALGLSSKSVQPLDDPSELNRIRITDIEGLKFCRETQEAAEAAGDSALARVMRRKIRYYLARQAFWRVDRSLLHGAIRRRWRQSRKGTWKGPGVPPWERVDFKHGDE